MSDSSVDSSKRTWLIASGCAGAVGGVATAVPFVSSFQPSEKAKAAGAAVEVDISDLKPGEKLTAEWRGKPIWIMRRTPEQLAEQLQQQWGQPVVVDSRPGSSGNIAAAFVASWSVPLLWLAAGAWIAAFGGFCVAYAPLLLRKRRLG